MHTHTHKNPPAVNFFQFSKLLNEEIESDVKITAKKNNDRTRERQNNKILMGSLTATVSDTGIVQKIRNIKTLYSEY